MKNALPLNVLLVDDDVNICRTLGISLKDQNCTVTTVNRVNDAVEILKQRTFDLILTDFRMEGKTGLDLIQDAKIVARQSIVVVMTAFASIENAVSVVKEGAFDYLPKPFTTSQLSHLLQKVRVVVGLRRENEELKRSRGRRDYFAGLCSPASRRLEEFVRKVAPNEATVLLVGESGTGKSELARLIHEWSPRAPAPFVTVQCSSLAESLLESELFGHAKGAFTGATQDKIGKLELADSGTLFLDEIGDLPLSGQAKLLRFLQERVFERVGSNREITVDTRVIAATNKDLEEAVTSGKFREDLYYRLNILECRLVPLRFRVEDIPVMVTRFLDELRKKYGEKTPTALPENIRKIFLRYSWPGNVREIRNAIERMVMLSQGRDVRADDLPESLLSPPPVLKGDGALATLQEVEREHIQAVLARETNLEKAAKILGITTVTLWRKRKEYGLN